MSDPYKNIFAKDLLPLIDEVALDAMRVPVFSSKFDEREMTIHEISYHNGMVAMHNDGVRAMALLLKSRIEDGEDDGDG